MKTVRFYLILGLFVFVEITVLGQSSQYTVEKAPISSSNFDEFSPCYFKDGIIFCSNKKNSVLVTYTDTTEEARELFDLYFAKPSKDLKKWKGPELLQNSLNTRFNDGPASFYQASTKVVFNRNLYAPNKFGNYLKSGNTMGLFFASYSRGDWGDIWPFEHNSQEYNILHPTITEDGKYLYFASDMPGGLGGYDIYISVYRNGQWSLPQNLGPKINTSRNEAFPFIHNSGRLYFSSKAWNSRGGFDIFFSQKIGANWIQAQNIKEPFNSTADDFGFIIDEYLQTGFFSSTRNKNDDIFQFRSAISEFENCVPQKTNNFCYVFYEEGTASSDIDGVMKYEWDMGDGTKIRSLEAEHCFAKVGRYKVQLNVVDSITGELLLSQAQYDFEVEEIEQAFINAPMEVKVGESLKIDATQSNLKNFRIAKYYWDFGDGAKGIGEKYTHTFYEPGVYDVKLQLESVPSRDGVKKTCVYRSVEVKAMEP